MAKTKAASRKRPVRPGPQAPNEVWTPAQINAAIRRGSRKSKLLLLQKIGVLDKNGEPTAKYRSWGNKASRTPELESAAKTEP